MKWKAVGQNAVIIYFADKVTDESLATSMAIAAELEENPPDGLRDFIPGYTSVLMEFAPPHDAPLETRARSLAARLQKLPVEPLPDWPIKEIPVRYDGQDLSRVAEKAKLSEKEVVELHAAPVYRVHMLGFTPGFSYMAGLDERLHTPRFENPRLMVRAGSVGIGGQQTGIYTVDGPAGWNIIGRTDIRPFDPSAAEPFMFKQGDRVKFIPV